MTTGLSPTQALLRMQRKNYFVGASVLLGSLGAHCLVTWSLPLRSGEPASPYFQVFFLLPFILSMYSPDSWLPKAASGGVGLCVVLGPDAKANLSHLQRQTW